MGNSRIRVRPVVESIEARTVPSTMVPVLTMHTVDAVVADVHRVMGTLARDHNVAQAGQHLERLSALIPNGPRELAPAWKADLALDNRALPGTGHATLVQLLRDLHRDVVRGVQAHEFQVIGAGSRAYTAPPRAGATASSVDNVKIVNLTGFSIKVTAFLNGVNPRPSITQTIANGATSPFNFNTNKNLPIAINVVRSDNPQVPPPLVNHLLNHPNSGYNGASFTVSVFGGVFSIGG